MVQETTTTRFSREAMPQYEPQWQYLDASRLWGDCWGELQNWLEKHYVDDPQQTVVWEASDRLRWRYDFKEMKQFRVERENEAAEWTVTSTKVIRRILKPIPY